MNVAAPWYWQNWFLASMLMLAVALTYLPVWRAGYIWDDDVHLTANPCIVGPLGLKEIWTTSAAMICPLVLTTFWVEHAIWGLEPLPYHLVNVALHMMCALLLWRVLRSLNVPGAWLGAALWALHPIQVETVAWISELKNTQSCLFYLLAIDSYIKVVKARDGRLGWPYGLTLFFAACAMASKSSTVILPLVLCLCAWWLEGRWNRQNLIRVSPLFLLSIAAAALSIWTQGLHPGNADLQAVHTWPQRLGAAGDGVWFYLGKLLWPHPLITLYPSFQIDAGRLISYIPLLAVITAWLFLSRTRLAWSRPLLFAFTYFLIALLPELEIADNYVADHYQYLSSMGPLALAGAGLVVFLDFAIPAKPLLKAIFCGGLLVILGGWSWCRAWVYESQETLWTDTLAKNPGCWIGYSDLGDVLEQKGQIDQAVALFQKALQVDPNRAEFHNNLAAALVREGRGEEAIVHFQKALEINPNFTEARNNLGNAFLRQGQLDAAIIQFQKAMAGSPEVAEIHNNLGVAYAQKGHLDFAIAEFQKAVHLNPNYLEAQNNLDRARGMLRQAPASK